MQQNYSKKIDPIQKASKNTASSVLDASSQSEALQRKADMASNAAQREETPRPNNTGMPDNLKSGIESLSGFSMDDVRVHYNSSKPATVQALAYTQGTDIHVAPGQEKHLPHEAWHVAQQMAGRVSPTTNINGMPVNDNAGLEHEADVMGEKAVGQRTTDSDSVYSIQKKKCNNIVQRAVDPKRADKEMKKAMAPTSSLLASSSSERLISKYTKGVKSLIPGLALLESTSENCYVHVSGLSEEKPDETPEYNSDSEQYELVTSDSKKIRSFITRNNVNAHITLEYRYLEAMIRLIEEGHNDGKVALTPESTSLNLNFYFFTTSPTKKIERYTQFTVFINELHNTVRTKITATYTAAPTKMNHLLREEAKIFNQSVDFANSCKRRLLARPVEPKVRTKRQPQHYELFVEDLSANEWLNILNRV